MWLGVLAVLGCLNLASASLIDTTYVRYREDPFRVIDDVKFELVKRSIAHMNHLAGFDTLGGMGLGKRSKAEPDQAGEKRAALSTFDSLGGMGLGKRSMTPGHSQHLSSLDTLGGMGFGRRK